MCDKSSFTLIPVSLSDNEKKSETQQSIRGKINSQEELYKKEDIQATF